jgi:hypothetical protein
MGYIGTTCRHGNPFIQLIGSQNTNLLKPRYGVARSRRNCCTGDFYYISATSATYHNGDRKWYASNDPIGAESTQYGSTQYGSTQYGSTQYGSTQYGSTQYGSTQYGSTQYGSTQYGYAGSHWRANARAPLRRPMECRHHSMTLSKCVVIEDPKEATT